MSAETTARNRWFLIAGARIATAAGAVLGLILLAKAPDTVTRVLGVALVLASLYLMAVLPLALAHRWRSRER